jgi:hypothetical protein
MARPRPAAWLALNGALLMLSGISLVGSQFRRAEGWLGRQRSNPRTLNRHGRVAEENSGREFNQRLAGDHFCNAACQLVIRVRGHEPVFGASADGCDTRNR